MADIAPAPAADPQAQAADPDKAREDALCAQKWIAELGASEKFQRKWLEKAKKIARKYKRDDSDTSRERKYAMLWSNTQTEQPAIYTRAPEPVVIRRFQDADPVGRVAAEVLQRALAFSIDDHDLDGVLRADSFDFVLYARGQSWERYIPTHGDPITPEIDLQVVGEGETVEYTDEDGASYDPEDVQFRENGAPYAMGQPFRPVVYEESVTDYVNWEDFGHSPARTWDEVSYVWRRVYLSRKELLDRFGPVGKFVPLDWGPVQQGARDTAAAIQQKAAVYEVWSKADKMVYWISKSWSSRPLDQRPDPLGLPGFFPCPRPLLGTTANDSVMPTPEFVFYQHQADEIDVLTTRISTLQDALKVRGFYAGDGKTNLNNLLNSANNILIPVSDWQSLKEDGGLKGRIEWFPLDQVVAALNALIQQRQQLIDDVYRITGIAEILRGGGDPGATATGDGIRAQWGTLRIRDRQIEMMRFARDVLRIKGAVIANKFSWQTLKTITGVQLPTNADKAQAQGQIARAQQQYELQVAQAKLAVQAQAAQAQAAVGPSAMGQQPGPMPAQPPAPPQPQLPPPQIPPQVQQMLASPSWEDVEALLQDPNDRSFRIEIETDSTIEPNEAAEKAATVQFVTALGSMIGEWGPMIQQEPGLAPLAGAVMKYAARRFKAGRELEDVIDQTVDQMTTRAVQASAAGPTSTPPADKTPLQVAVVNQQTEQITQDGETQRAVIEASVERGEQQLRAAELAARVVPLHPAAMPGALG